MKLPLTLCYVSALAFLALPAGLAAIAACTSSPSETGTPDANCNSIEVTPPLLTVVNARTGSPVCDPTVAQLLPDAGLGPLTYQDCTTGLVSSGCPSPLADGAPPPCAFELSLDSQGIPQAPASTIEVSAPGFDTVTVPNVVNGYGGCVPYSAPSAVTVQLTPLADGGTDGSPGDAAADAPTFIADCGAIELYSPVVAAVNAATGSPLCDPTIAVLLPDAGLDPLTYSECTPTFTNSPMDTPCPNAPEDAAPPCEFGLSLDEQASELMGLNGSITIEVSAPGFATATVPKVVEGVGGCTPYVAGFVTVPLTPLADGGGDASDAAGD